MGRQSSVTFPTKMVLTLLLFSVITSVVLSANDQCLFLVLVDGVRRDYIEGTSHYGFRELRENGVEAEYLRPIMPSNSYPNWYTIATGKYAEGHGFINNYMYDRERNDYFTASPPSDDKKAAYWWNQTEPIWTTAEKNGIKTGMYWWDGCQVEIDGIRPTECLRYRPYFLWATLNHDVEKQMLVTLQRIRNNELCFAMLYYEPVDGYGHRKGPDSQATKHALRSFDKILYSLQEQMKNFSLEEKLNLVVLSDHGMTTIAKDETKTIDITNVVDDSDIEVMLDVHFFSMLWTRQGKEEKVYKVLKNEKIKGLNVYRKEEVPEKYHLRDNKLIAPIVLTADKGYTIVPYKKAAKMKPYFPLGHFTVFLSPGVHGFDPYSEATKDMRTIFYARGPSFKKNYTAAPMEMTDVYNVFCHSLGIQPLPNNGSWDRIKDFLL